MNVVVYSTDFEPINIIEIPRYLLDRAEQRGFLKIALNSSETSPVITVWCKKILWHDSTIKTVLITQDEVLMLTLPPTWLPGQSKAIQSALGLVRKLHNKVIELMRKN